MRELGRQKPHIVKRKRRLGWECKQEVNGEELSITGETASQSYDRLSGFVAAIDFMETFKVFKKNGDTK